MSVVDAVSAELPIIWAGLIAVAVLMYVIMDGFDLGIGILFPFVKGERHRDTMMNSVAPVWDGNETWLVLGGGGLYAVFPLAYSVLFTAFYAPLIAMLLALVFRGVAFEFRFRDPAHKPIWDVSFAGGSIAATFFQGIVLGAFIQGVAVEGRGYAGGWYDWLTPFTLVTGVSLVMGYALLGAGWLIMKTADELQRRAYRLMLPLAFAVLGAIALVSLWTALGHDEISRRWFTWPNLAYLAPVPILIAVVGLALLHAIVRRREAQPFLLTLVLFLLCYGGLAISLFPNIVPPEITIWDAAAPPESQGFLLVGAVFLLPIILGYTAYAYWIFRGKVRPDEGYH